MWGIGFAREPVVVGGSWPSVSTAYSSRNTADPTEITARTASGRCITAVDHLGTLRRSGYLTAADADSFDVNFTTADSNGVIVHYMLLGGSDITGSSVGLITGPGVTGSVAYTGLGFDPGLVVMSGVGSTATDSTQTSVDAIGSLGAACATTKRACTGWNDRDAQATSIANHVVRNSALIGETGSGANIADITAFTDGFTLNWTTLGRASARYAYLALKGPRFEVATFDSPAVDGDSSVTIAAGHQPSALFIGGAGRTTAVGTSAAIANTGFGATDGARRSAVGVAANDAAAAATTATDQREDKIVALPTGAAAQNETADISSLLSNGFTLNWDKVLSAAATRYWYLSIAPNQQLDGGVDATSIATGEAFGVGTMFAGFTGEGIASAEAFGVGSLVGPLSDGGAIATGEAFGVGALLGGIRSATPTPRPTWRMAYVSLDGTFNGEIRNAKQRSFKWLLNHPSSVSFRLDARNSMMKEMFTRGGEGYILVYQGDQLRMTAEISSAEISAAPVPGARQPGVAITATETMWPILQGRLIGKSREGFSVETATDRGQVLEDLMNTLHAENDLGLHMGSREALPTMAGGPWHYKPLMELWLELSATVNGFDFWQEPLDPSAAASLGHTGNLHLYAVKGSVKDNAILEFGVGKRNARDYRWTVDGTRRINRAFALPSDYPDNALLEVVSAEDATSITTRGLREEVVAQDLVDATLRQQLVNEHVAVRKAPMQRFFMNPVVSDRAPTVFTDYGLGDTCEGRVLDSGTVLLNAQVRVYGIEVSLDENGQETDTITWVEEE